VLIVVRSAASFASFVLCLSALSPHFSDMFVEENTLRRGKGVNNLLCGLWIVYSGDTVDARIIQSCMVQSGKQFCRTVNTSIYSVQNTQYHNI